ncbi:MAG: hypothetical protein KDD19_02165 [Phaeodactylibacter sp.]|nr:hypothetical protein [Phaeodactylibacter sp.]MCB9048166.1 hypothetical protein [Lewinellaceae bacterium]
MWQGLQDILNWLNDENESSTPEETSISNIVKLAALSAMATILERRLRDNHDSDENTPQPGAGK